MQNDNGFGKGQYTKKVTVQMSETKPVDNSKAKGETLGADSKEGDVRMSNIVAAKGDYFTLLLIIRSCC